MFNIIYREINKEIEEKIVNIFGEWVTKYNCLHYGEGCYSVAAMLDNQPIGFISTYPRYYPEPLSEYSYVAKMLNPFENYPHIVDKICEEIKNALPNASLQKIRLIRAKNGVYVYRGKLDNQSVVIKYFEKEDDKREISNYRILNELKIPTIRVVAYGVSCIVLEDIDYSDIWRLGKEEDLRDEAVTLQLAHWYFDFHEKGSLYGSLDEMYHETYDITEANLEMLCKRLPEARDTFSYIKANLGKLKSIISETAQTFNYNDFYWTNLLVRKDKCAAMPFDYNLLGAGYRYSDLRNVTSSLSIEAGKAFLTEYNKLYKEKHGRNREIEELKEKQIDKVSSCLIALIAAYKLDKFPSWVNAEKDFAQDGSVLKAAKELFEHIN